MVKKADVTAAKETERKRRDDGKSKNKEGGDMYYCATPKPLITRARRRLDLIFKMGRSVQEAREARRAARD